METLKQAIIDTVLILFIAVVFYLVLFNPVTLFGYFVMSFPYILFVVIPSFVLLVIIIGVIEDVAKHTIKFINNRRTSNE